MGIIRLNQRRSTDTAAVKPFSDNFKAPVFVLKRIADAFIISIREIFVESIAHPNC